MLSTRFHTRQGEMDKMDPKVELMGQSCYRRTARYNGDELCSNVREESGAMGSENGEHATTTVSSNKWHEIFKEC